MANIQVSELNPAGSELFIDAESFLQDLTDTDAMVVQGGQGGDINKLLEFGIGAYAINNVVSLAKSFSAAPGAAIKDTGGEDDDEENGANGNGANGPGTAGFGLAGSPGLPGLGLGLR